MGILSSHRCSSWFACCWLSFNYNSNSDMAITISITSLSTGYHWPNSLLRLVAHWPRLLHYLQNPQPWTQSLVFPDLLPLRLISFLVFLL
jgi:hypothetical protein